METQLIIELGKRGMTDYLSTDRFTLCWSFDLLSFLNRKRKNSEFSVFIVWGEEEQSCAAAKTADFSWSAPPAAQYLTALFSSHDTHSLSLSVCLSLSLSPVAS